jgi:hypothetical protein
LWLRARPRIQWRQNSWAWLTRCPTTGGGRGIVCGPGRGAYTYVNQGVQIVFDHSRCPGVGPPARGGAVCCHLPYRDGCLRLLSPCLGARSLRPSRQMLWGRCLPCFRSIRNGACASRCDIQTQGFNRIEKNTHTIKLYLLFWKPTVKKLQG